MFQYMADVAEKLERVKLTRAKVRLKLAEAQRVAWEAASMGSSVPPGHAWVNALGIHLIPHGPNQMASSSSSIAAAAAAPEIDIVQECLEPQQAYAFVGGARQGKSWAAQHVAARWQQDGRHVLVIAPKWNPGEWRGCKVLGPEPEMLLAGLETVRQMARLRREESVRREMPGDRWAPVLIVLDDWLLTLRYLGDEARDFISEAAIIYASQNVTVLTIVHADTSAGWGVDKVGKGLVEDYYRVIVRKRAGNERSYGVLYPGERVRRESGREVFDRYGYLPAGPPRWAEDTRGDTWRDTCPPRGDAPGEMASGGSGIRAEYQRAAQAAKLALPPAPPAQIEVLDRKVWRRVELSYRDGMKARRAYERRGQLQDVAQYVSSGSKQTRLAIARALLGIAHPSWRHAR